MNLITYNNISIPSIMYGTAWKKESTSILVKQAISSGFTAIDTANQLIHYDEALVGEAIQEKYKEGIKREDLFIQTKFTSINGQGKQLPYDSNASLTTQVKQSFDSSLTHLHTDYIDSYVLHGPYSRVGLTNADWEVWSAIEDLYQSGKTKIIGVSNVNKEQLELLCQKAKIKPMIVQNRCFAALAWDLDVREICQKNNIIYQGFSLLTANRNEIMHPKICSIAEKFNATIPQVIFKFSKQIGMLPLTGTTNIQHMKDDLLCDSLELSNEELTLIENIGI